jgi:ANTAR domain.
MPDRSVVRAAESLSSAYATGSSLCRPFVDALPIDRAAISTLVAPFGAQTVCASDGEAARLDELQLDLGEGPCWSALEARRFVIARDLSSAAAQPWPAFAEALRRSGVRTVASFPLYVASLNIGAVDVYSHRTDALRDEAIAAGSLLAGIAATQILRRALEGVDRSGTGDGGAPDDGRYSRREVHQATGMVVAQLRVAPDDALVLIRAYAFASDRSVRTIAVDIVSGLLDLTVR